MAERNRAMDKHDELAQRIAREIFLEGYQDDGISSVFPDKIIFARRYREALRAEWEKERGLIPHDFYKDGDVGIPEQIKDRNGQVVLSLCKLCNQAEGELVSDYCPTESREEIEAKWQPIETAPKDQTEVILFDPTNNPTVFTGKFIYDWGASTEGRNCPEDGFYGDPPKKPTHWQPLPTPPQKRAASGAEGEKG